MMEMLRIPPEVAEKVVLGEPEAEDILAGTADVDGQLFFVGNAWAAVHFTLSGEYPLTKEECGKAGISFREDQLENMLMGGDATVVDTGCGKVRYMSRQEVLRNWELFSEIGPEKFRGWYSVDSLEAEGIPPEGWSAQPDREGFRVDVYEEIREFYRDAVDDRQCIVLEFVSSRE